jgi:hypothetical protein
MTLTCKSKEKDHSVLNSTILVSGAFMSSFVVGIMAVASNMIHGLDFLAYLAYVKLLFTIVK